MNRVHAAIRAGAAACAAVVVTACLMPHCHREVRYESPDGRTLWEESGLIVDLVSARPVQIERSFGFEARYIVKNGRAGDVTVSTETAALEPRGETQAVRQPMSEVVRAGEAKEFTVYLTDRHWYDMHTLPKDVRCVLGEAKLEDGRRAPLAVTLELTTSSH